MHLILAMLAASAPVWIVVEPVANMYSGPSLDADVVSQAIYATAVERVDSSEGWVRVRTPDDYLGWIPETSLQERPAPYAAAGKIARVESLFGNLYREPDVTRHRPLLTLPYEVRLEVVVEPEDAGRRWIEVRLPDDRTAWVQRGDLSFDDTPLTIDEVIALARRFTGLPYLWGGTSSFGLDCSGFTQLLCRRRGIQIPRDSGPQFRSEKAVPVLRQALRPGDLLFFGEEPDKITHTGMYIGDGQFVHATAYLRPMVQVSRLDDPHWSALLVGCRRVQ